MGGAVGGNGRPDFAVFVGTEVSEPLDIGLVFCHEMKMLD